ncbi:MAG: M3 family metallopeptidase [Candidatus Paceibacterota bacterium]
MKGTFSKDIEKKAYKYIDLLNNTYAKLHQKYEDLFWTSYMGDHSADKDMNKALLERDSFGASTVHAEKLKSFLPRVGPAAKARINAWLAFFDCYQEPLEVKPLKEKMNALEAKIHDKVAARKEGYTDPETKSFTAVSYLKMRGMMATHNDEKIRKACFDACQSFALGCLDEYVEMIALRNEYARALGYSDFYDYKVRTGDKMSKKELFSIFNTIHDKTKFSRNEIKKLEKKMPGLRKPWNFDYMMAGDFIKEEDQYLQFEDALPRWGASFAALGIDYRNGSIALDMLDRAGKYNNGFCHWPKIVQFKNGKRIPGSSNFTCNVVPGQPGSGEEGYLTLFHEGGHAAHILNTEQRDACMNTEYPPATAAWTETQSMFLDSIFSSIEWKTRYAKNSKGESYPFDLFRRKAEKLHFLEPLFLDSIIMISTFEKEIYETRDLTKEKVLSLAKKNYRRYSVASEDSLWILNVNHIYHFQGSAEYHGYGLAFLAVCQWREYFYKKYGYIVDNPNVGKEMEKVWRLGASRSFNEFVMAATGKKLSAEAFLKEATSSIDAILRRAKRRINRLKTVPARKGKIGLNAKISVVHGKKAIATNKKSFEDMAEKYRLWIKTLAD